MKTIFLDIEGCMTTGKTEELVRLPMFEECLRASGVLDELQIVVSSDWRHKYNVDQLRAFFSPDVAKRIVDVTGSERWRRDLEIEEYVTDHSISEWIVVDDLLDHFPDYGTRLIHCNRKEGFTFERGAELLEFLDGCPGPGTGHGRWSKS